MGGDVFKCNLNDKSLLFSRNGHFHFPLLSIRFLLLVFWGVNFTVHFSFNGKELTY